MRNSFLLAALILCSCMLGIIATYWVLKPTVQPVNPCEYQFIVTDDSLTVYYGIDTLGTVKLEGQLDSLITLDNQ